MPRIYRTMLCDGPSPKVGDGADMLGARSSEMRLDERGLAIPGGGISVAPQWRLLPPHRIPKRFRTLTPEARGKDDRVIWQAGEGAFEAMQLTEKLSLVITNLKHGQLEPTTPMLATDFQGSLAATRNWWRPIDEEPERFTAQMAAP